jgi:hypothetical protein
MAKAYLPLPSASDLWEIFDYKPLTGELVWKKTQRTDCIGKVVGSLTGTGYLVTVVNGKMYQLHRLVWVWVYGNDPGAIEMDHRDRNRTNNRWYNLRLADFTQNRINTATQSNNTTGVRGVNKRGNTYVARIRVRNKRHHLGSFASLEEAAVAYKKAAEQLHGEFAPV